MERCGFFDANLVGEEYDRVYLSQHFAAYFASFIGNGVFAGKSNELQVMALSTPQMKVSVLGGQGYINGYWYENTDNLILNIDNADGVLNRIDSVVLRLGYAERDMWLAIKKGVPAVTPIAPGVTRSADFYELQLATISVPASSINITQSRISDTRLNKSVCGWVTGLVQQIDTTTLFNQFETYFEEFKNVNEQEYINWTNGQQNAYILWITTQQNDYTNWTTQQKNIFENWYETNITKWQNDFNTWFDGVKDQLSEDAAGNIQNQLNEHEARLDTLELMLIKGNVFAPAEASSEELLSTYENEVILFQWEI